MKNNIRFVLSLTLLFCMFLVGSVAADIAPPLQPPGAVPGLAEFVETRVEMGYESVTIYVEESTTLYYPSPSNDTVNGRVTATFMMFNTGTVEETLEVVFPLMSLQGMGDVSGRYPEIQNFTVSANFEPLQWETVETPNPTTHDETPIKWAQFEVTFPTDEVVFIDVTYDLQSTGYFPNATFSYVLETGAGWYGPIGEAYLTLVMPYKASTENVLVDAGTYMHIGGDNNPEPVFEDKEVTWHWTNLEPTKEDNWGVTVIAPHIWLEVELLREEIAMGRRGAYKAITKWYDALIIDRGIREGTEGLIPLNLEAYQKAMLDDPWDDEVPAKYASFLLFLYGFGRESDEYQGMLDDIYRLASEALEMDQFNPTALQVLNDLEKSYDYEPHEKAEVVPAQSKSKEESEVVEEPEVDAAPAVVEQPAEKANPLIYFLGGALAAALVVVLVLLMRMRKNKK